VNGKFTEIVLYIFLTMVGVNVALADSVRENVLILDRATVKVAFAERVTNFVFCNNIETVLAKETESVLYNVSAFTIVTVNVAFAESVL